MGITTISKQGLFATTSLSWVLAAVVFFSAWIWRELSVKNPLLDVRLLAKPAIAWPNIVMIFVALGVYQGGHLMSLFGQQPLATGIGLGLTATMAGFLLLPANICAGLTTPFVGAAVHRFGPRNLARLGCNARGSRCCCSRAVRWSPMPTPGGRTAGSTCTWRYYF
jgi:hypothetical protein